MSKIQAWKALVASGMFCCGCAQRTELEPAPAARQMPGLEQAAISSVEGVSMVAQADEWEGAAPVKREVTPIRVAIENGSDRPLLVRYNAFQLVGPQGEVFSALPPFRIGGDVEEPALQEQYSPIADPAWEFEGFEVAPFYGPVYPGVAAFEGPFYYDPNYYDRYTGVWEDVDLPTQTMLERAMPEGVLEPGGRVEGTLYFEKVDEDLPRVQYRANLISARDGEVFGSIQIPFLVEAAEEAGLGA